MSIKVELEQKSEEIVKTCIEKAMKSLDDPKDPCSSREEVRGENFKYAYYVKSRDNSRVRPNGKKGYPPKETLRRAYRLAYKRKYIGRLNGGEEANTTLMRYGFKAYHVKNDKLYGELPSNKN